MPLLRGSGRGGALGFRLMNCEVCRGRARPDGGPEPREPGRFSDGLAAGAGKRGCAVLVVGERIRRAAASRYFLGCMPVKWACNGIQRCSLRAF